MLEFDEATHTYTLDGARVPSVTQVLDRLGTYAGIPADVLARKAEIGDAVHYATELHDRDELDAATVPDEIAGYLIAWLKFRDQTGFEPEFIEQRVFSSTFRYAGTCDRIGTFSALRGVKPAEYALIDLKCTYRILPAVGAQLAAYRHAWNESANRALQVRRRFAVLLKSDGTYRLEECADQSDWSVFVAALTLHNWRERHGEKHAEA